MMHGPPSPNIASDQTTPPSATLSSATVGVNGSMDATVQPSLQAPGKAGYKIVIKAGQTEHLYWRDLWRYRELLFLLTYRDISVHYKQTIIGIAWALIRPLATMMVFVFVFSKIARLPSGDVPYPLLVLAGMLPWQLFASALNESSNSLVNNANLVSKVYFPRLIVPLSALGVSLVDFLICLPVLIGLMFAYQVVPTWRLAFLPLFIGLALAAAYGLGLWLCALNVRYRDVRYMIPFVVQFGLYLCPVGYSSSIVPQEWRWVYALNPMAGAIDGMRWSLFGPSAPPPFGELSFAVSLLFVVVLLIGGIRYFRRTERTFADVI
jgi:lipopolysaccharide transport system permease protein